jgi:ferrochelatase
MFTAHSLPLSVVRQGDPYPLEVTAMADAVTSRAGIANPWRVVYQSQGATSDPWLGPDIRESLLHAAEQRATDVVFCPIGFLSDHIEILYDLDIEAKAQAEQAGLAFARTTSLNDSPALADAIVAVARRLAGRG